MWSETDVIVISDLHLAAERGQGLFQADTALSKFLTWVRKETKNSHLILAGDVLDFLALEPNQTAREVFQVSTAPQQAVQIIAHHEEVFAALAQLAQSPRHRLTILSGNHDPELALPTVQAAIVRQLFPRHNSSALNWQTNGAASWIQVGPAHCVIEHGDLYDDWNRIDHDGLRQMAALVSRGIDDQRNFKSSPGSKLVVKFLTQLRRNHAWIDLLKPERETVVPIIRELLPVREQMKLLPGLQMLNTERKVTSLLRECQRLRNPSQNYRDEVPETKKRRRFRDYLRKIDRPELSRREAATDRWDGVIQRLREVAEEDDFFDITAPEESLVEDQTFLLAQGADLLIHGHTHAAKAYPVGNGLYLNSGTWGQLLRLPASTAPDEVWHTFLTGLAENRYESELRATFVRVQEDKEDGNVTATLYEWRDAQPMPLSAWRFEGAAHTWRPAA